MIVVAALLGYLIGSIPSADWVGRLHGVDPRDQGTGNPGAANTFGLAGKRAGLMVLVIDVARGAAAAVIARALAGDTAGLVATIAATMGQKFNPWYRFKGGKGLAVSAGTTAVVWPPMIFLGVPLILGAVRLSRSAARGALFAIVGMVVIGLLWGIFGLENLWGVEPTRALLAYALVLAALLAPKFVIDVHRELVSK